MIKVGFDLDNTIFDFDQGYLKRFKKFPNYDWAITRNVNNILIKERDFWINLPVIRRPDFIPTLYCTARVNKKVWTKKAIEINDLPDSPVFQIPGYHLSKAKYIKGRIDVFVEDSIKNFLDLNRQGIPCLLINNKFNEHLGPILRIYSLNYNEIEDVYNLGKITGIFDNFDKYYDI
jgi:FMN phosphatase YigB (HAD superfamily)